MRENWYHTFVTPASEEHPNIPRIEDILHVLGIYVTPELDQLERFESCYERFAQRNAQYHRRCRENPVYGQNTFLAASTLSGRAYAQDWHGNPFMRAMHFISEAALLIHVMTPKEVDEDREPALKQARRIIKSLEGTKAS